MSKKSPKTVYQIMLGVFMLTITIAACNNSSEKKEPAADTTVMKAPSVTDTTKMDTASTRNPVKPAD